MLEQDIIMAYYYQAGVVEAGLRTDKQYQEAVRLLNHPEEYEKLLSVE
jgi:carboxyl-terminal processing protease